jgi:hypothetical protein
MEPPLLPQLGLTTVLTPSSLRQRVASTSGLAPRRSTANSASSTASPPERREAPVIP